MKHPDLITLIVDKLDDLKAQDVQVLDVSKQTSITDYMIIATGTSSQHVRSIAQYLYEETKKAGHRPIGVEGEESGEWVLLDLVDAIVHVMLPETRAYYELEKLWQVKDIDTRIGLPKSRKAKAASPKSSTRQSSAGQKSIGRSATAKGKPAASAKAAAPTRRAKTTGKPVSAKAAPKRTATKPARTKAAAPKRSTKPAAKTARTQK